MHWDSIYDLATLGMWADPSSYAWYVGGPLTAAEYAGLSAESGECSGLGHHRVVLCSTRRDVDEPASLWP